MLFVPSIHKYFIDTTSDSRVSWTNNDFFCSLYLVSLSFTDQSWSILVFCLVWKQLVSLQVLAIFSGKEFLIFDLYKKEAYKDTTKHHRIRINQLKKTCNTKIGLEKTFAHIGPSKISIF